MIMNRKVSRGHEECLKRNISRRLTRRELTCEEAKSTFDGSLCVRQRKYRSRGRYRSTERTGSKATYRISGRG